MADPCAFLTAKDLARILNLSPKTVFTNEERLGLRGIRIAINKRVIRYPRKEVAKLPAFRGLIA